MHLCDFSAKLEAIALPSQAIATFKAMAEKVIDSLKLMGGFFDFNHTHTHCNASSHAAVGRSKIDFDEAHTSALAQGGTLTREKEPAQSISSRTIGAQVKGKKDKCREKRHNAECRESDELRNTMQNNGGERILFSLTPTARTALHDLVTAPFFSLRCTVSNSPRAFN